MASTSSTYGAAASGAGPQARNSGSLMSWIESAARAAASSAPPGGCACDETGSAGGGARRRGRGRRGGPWHAALGEAVERRPDRLAHGLLRRARLEPHEQRGDLRARQVAEGVGEGAAIRAGEQREHAILGRMTGD